MHFRKTKLKPICVRHFLSLLILVSFTGHDLIELFAQEAVRIDLSKIENEYPGKPIPSDPKIYTQARYDKDYVRFRRHHLVSVYQKHSQDNEEVQALVLRFFKGYVKRLYRYPDDIIHLAKKAEKAGCKDPLFQAYYGYTVMRQNRQKGVELIESALKHLPDSKYTKMTSYMATHWLVNESKTSEQRRAAISRMSHAMVALATEQREKPGPLKNEARFLWNRLKLQIEGYRNRPYLTEVVGAFEKSTTTDEWLKAMVLGYCHWQISFGYSDDSEEWPKRNNHLKQAIAHVTNASKLQPKYPEAGGLMMEIINSTQESEFEALKDIRYWFDQSVRGQIDWMPAYQEMFEYLRSHNLDDYLSLIAFGQDCAATKRYDTKIPWQLFQAFYKLQYDHDSQIGNVWAADGAFEILEPMFNGYVTWSRENKPENLDYQLSYLIALCIKNKKFEKAHDYLKMVKVQPSDRPLSDMKIADKNIYGKIPVMLSEAWPLIQMVDALIEKGELKNIAFDDWVSGLNEEASRQQSDVKRYLKGQSEIIRTVRDFQKYQWLDLPVDAFLSGWDVEGKWSAPSVEGQRVIQLEASGSRGSQIRWNYPFTFPLVAEVDVHVVKHVKHARNAGILVGDYKREAYRPSGKLFWVDDSQKRVGYTNIYKGALGWDRKNFKPVNRLRIYIWRDYFRIVMNGQSVGGMYETTFNPAGKIGLGNLINKTQQQTLQFSNFRIRKLAYLKPEYSWDDPLAGRMSEEYVEVAPDSYAAHYARAVALAMSLNQPELAVKSYEKALSLKPDASEALCALGSTYYYMQQYQQAKHYYQQSLASKENDLCHVLLALLESSAPDETVRDGQAAIARLLPICKKQNYHDPDFLMALGGAYAETGKFDLALKYHKQATRLFRHIPLSQVEKDEIRIRHEMYTKEQSYRFDPLTHWMLLPTEVWQNKVNPEVSLPPKIKNGLLARWSFDETWRESGDYICTFPLGIPRYADGVIGRSISLQRGKIIQVKSGLDLEAKRPFSISFWLKSSLKGRGLILGKANTYHGGNAYSHGYQMYIHRGELEMYLGAGRNNLIQIKTMKAGIANDVWRHVTVVYDGGMKAKGIRIFVDGQQARIQKVKDQLTRDIGNDAAFQIGNLDGQFWYIGKLDELLIYNRKLSGQEVTSLYSQPLYHAFVKENAD